MRYIKIALILQAIIVLGLISKPALAHGPSVRFGVVIGEPIYRPYYPYYPAPYYYYPPVVVAPPAPQIYSYTERSSEEPPPPQQAYWYYCPASKAYYPYVTQCSSDWQRVAPAPPPGP